MFNREITLLGIRNNTKRNLVMKYVGLQIRKVMTGLVVNFRRENFMAAFLFSLISWELLYSWLYLMHSIDETVASTVLSSSLIHVLIITAACSFIFQKRSGVLTGLVAITAGFIFIFINSIVIFNLIFDITPDINDFIFYYECFLLIFFCGMPVYSFIRMI